jgi:hypothetical protein
MATIAYASVAKPDTLDMQSVSVIKWAAMGNADAGQAIRVSNFSDRSVQVTGTWGGATIVLEGSNDGSTYFTLNDPFNVAISKTAGFLSGVIEACLWVRPRTSGGTGTALDVVLFCRGNIKV